MKRAVVLGAGISGLAAAWHLKKTHGPELEITILEKSGRPGGWIKTIENEDFLFEQGPRGFRPAGKGCATLALVKELGLEGELTAADRQIKRRYLCLKGKLSPLSFGLLMKNGLLGAVWRDLRTPKTPLSDESVANFFRRRFNDRITMNIIDPFTKGVFGGNAEALSVRSCFPSLWNYEQKRGSVIRGLFGNAEKKKKERHPPLYSFKKGMERLPKALAEHFSIEYDREVSSFDEIDADLIVSALPAHALAPLLGMHDPLSYATLSVVCLGWRGSQLKQHGYGFLVPSKERRELLGMTFDSDIFPEQNRGVQTRICAMIGGAKTHNVLLSTALQSVEELLGITQPPQTTSISTARRAIPQYTVGHFEHLAAFEKALPSRVRLVGNSFYGVAINDCIAAASSLE